MGQWVNFFSRKGVRSEEKHLLVIDIGTEFVKALVVKLSNNKKEKQKRKHGLVIGAARQRQMPGYMLAGVISDIDGVVSVCQKAVDQAVRMARIRPKKAIAGIAGEYNKGITDHFVCKRDSPEQEITASELQNIFQKAQWKSLNEMRSQLAWETGKPEIEIRLVNSLIKEIRIDGYQVVNPLDFRGGELFLSFFNVYAPMIHLRAIESVVKRLGFDLLSIVAEPYALTRVSGFDQGTGAIFIDVGGGTTDVALFRQGRIEGIKSFSLAGRTFTRRLARTFGLGYHEAEEIKIRHAEQCLSSHMRGKIRNILGRDTRVWLNGLELVFEEFDQTSFFPPAIMLCGGGSLLPEINIILNSRLIHKRWAKNFPFSKIPRVSAIKPEQVDNIFEKTKVMTGSESVAPLALASLAVEIINEEERMLPSLLRRVVRMMR